MQSPSTKSIGTLVALAVIAAAPSAESAMYRWIEPNGATTYSDQMPADPSRVRALTVINAPAAPSQFERHSQELIEAERDRRPGESSTAAREAPVTSVDLTSRDAEIGGRDLYGRDLGAQPRASGGGEVKG